MNIEYGFDLDHTLIHHGGKDDRLNDWARVHKIDDARLAAGMARCRVGFSPDRLLSVLGMSTSLSDELYEAIGGFDGCVYDDVLSAFDMIRSAGGRIHVITRGDQRFQKFKIETAFERETFDTVSVIERGSKASAIRNANCNLYVDDKLNELVDIATRVERVQMCQIVRSGVSRETGDFRVLSTLDELL